MVDLGKWVLWNEMMSQKVGVDVTFLLVLDIDVAKYCRGHRCNRPWKFLKGCGVSCLLIGGGGE